MSLIRYRLTMTQNDYTNFKLWTTGRIKRKFSWEVYPGRFTFLSGKKFPSGNFFYTEDQSQPQVPITTSSEPVTYASLHLAAVYIGEYHALLGRVESGKPLRLPGLSQWPTKDHRGTSVSGYLPLKTALRTDYLALRINSLHHLSSSRLAQESNPQ